MRVFTCSTTASVTVTSDGGVPTCSGGGEWVELDVTPWWAYEIPGEQVASLLGAQLLFVAVLIVCGVIDTQLARK